MNGDRNYLKRRSHLLKLLFEHPERLSAMGFPVDWRQMVIWQDIV
jgi:hypothetical protein